MPKESPGTCQEDRDGGGTEFSALSSGTESSMIEAADALLATTSSKGVRLANSFIEDRRLDIEKEEEVAIHRGGVSMNNDYPSTISRVLEMKDGEGGGDSLVSGRETDTIKRSPVFHATPETPIGRFFKRNPDKHSTPIVTNMILFASTGVTDAANHTPAPQRHCQPTTHHATNLPNNPTTTHTNQPPANQPKDTERTSKPPLPAARDRRRTRCTYVGAVGNLCGPGAKLKWKPTGCKTTTTKLSKECDVGLEGRKMF